MKRFALFAAILPFLALAASPSPGVAKTVAALSVPRCTINDLSLSFDEADGAFNGMSQAGALLVLRNTGAAPCSVPRLPSLTFQDAAHRPLTIAFRSPVGLSRMVLLPLPLSAQAEATGKMHWVSGDVYDGHNCASPTFVTLTVDGKTLTVPFGAHMCGAAGKSVPYDLAWLAPDVAFHPEPS